MVFYPPDFLPRLPFDPPDSITIFDFMFDEKYGRHPLKDSYPPFTDGLNGEEHSALEVRERVDYLARALAQEFGWDPNAGAEWDKVVCLFTVNTIDTLTLSWAIHRLSGISSPANAGYSSEELEYQLKSSGARALFTSAPLLPIALQAAAKAGISKDRVYLLDVPPALLGGKEPPRGFKTVEQLIKYGGSLKAVEPLRWSKGQGARQTAFLCYSSGTSGLPKGVMISHRNVISNVLQLATFESPLRAEQRKKYGPNFREVVLGLLPYSHIYGLVAVCHLSVYQGDKTVCLPKFEFSSFLNAIQTQKINRLYVVPPIIILMTKNKATCDKFDLSSVTTIWTGAAPLGMETAEDMHRLWPHWLVRQGYGMTEASTVASSTPYNDIDFGSSGCLLPGFEARIIAEDGKNITEYDEPGELLVKSPSVVLGYLNNEEANRETFQDGWLRSGDKAVIHKSPRGNEHVWIVDRMKELIKAKGLQVAPAELEALLLTHPAVADAAVIPIPDEKAGEVPKAYVVKSSTVGIEDNDRMLVRDIQRHVEKQKARHKWLQGGVEFINEIPKSPSGKILRRLLRDKEKESQRKKGSKL